MGDMKVKRGWGFSVMSFQSIGVLHGDLGKDFWPSFLHPFLENYVTSNCKDGIWEPIPVFDNPLRKGQPYPLAMALTLEYLVGMPS